MDRIIDGAEKHGLYVVLSPTWGRYVCPRRYERSYTPEIFDTKSADTYGKFLGRRYKDRPNIIWLMGGDRDYCASGVAIWDALANGIKSSGDSHLISYHPSSGHEGYTSSGFWLYENNNHQYPSWLDFNMSQPSSDNILKINRLDYRISPVKPTVVGESNYFMQQEPSDPAGSYALGVIRAQPYWSILTGAAGYTYGNNHIWWFDKDDGAFPDRRPFFRNKDGKIWSDDEYLNSAGTRWAVIWKDYFSTIDWWNLVPDQSAILTSENSSGEYEYKVAARTKTGDRVLVYFPNASSASIDLAKITSGGEYIDARWLKTTDGSIKHDSIIPSTSSSRIYTLPFGWDDGLLILEGADRKPDNQEIIKL